MPVRYPKSIPALIAFAPELARQESWGRLSELSASQTVLSTLCHLGRGERIFVSFEFAGERFLNVAAEVVYAQTDEDGFCSAEIRFKDEVQKRRLAKALLDTLARTS